MLGEGWKAWNLDSGSCRTFTASCARKSRITIVLSENCSFRPLRFSLMWCRDTLSSPAHRRFASSAETEVHTGVSARSRGSTVRPGRVSENRSGRLLVAYSRYAELSRCISKTTVALSARDPISLWVGLSLSPMGKKSGHA